MSLRDLQVKLADVPWIIHWQKVAVHARSVDNEKPRLTWRRVTRVRIQTIYTFVWLAFVPTCSALEASWPTTSLPGIHSGVTRKMSVLRFSGAVFLSCQLSNSTFLGLSVSHQRTDVSLPKWRCFFNITLTRRGPQLGTRFCDELHLSNCRARRAV